MTAPPSPLYPEVTLSSWQDAKIWELTNSLPLIHSPPTLNKQTNKPHTKKTCWPVPSPPSAFWDFQLPEWGRCSCSAVPTPARPAGCSDSVARLCSSAALALSPLTGDGAAPGATECNKDETPPSAGETDVTRQQRNTTPTIAAMWQWHWSWITTRKNNTRSVKNKCSATNETTYPQAPKLTTKSKHPFPFSLTSSALMHCLTNTHPLFLSPFFCLDELLDREPLSLSPLLPWCIFLTDTHFLLLSFASMNYLEDTHFLSLLFLSLIHIWRCRRLLRCRSRWSPYH